MSRRPPPQSEPSAKMGVVHKPRPPNLDEDEPTWHGLDCEGSGILSLPRALYDMTNITHLYLGHNRLTSISPDIANLRALTVLDLSFNRLRSLPSTMGELTEMLELMLSNNELMTLPAEMGKMHKIKFLALDNNPWSEPTASQIVQGTESLMLWLLDKAPTGKEPPPRAWIQPKAITKSTLQTHERSNRGIVTVFCYNILCDKYASRNMFKYCPSWALAWDYRKGRILKELVESRCDILCLQEVSKSEFYQYFLSTLANHSYNGCFKVKSRAMYHNDETIDGCATFFSTTSYRLLLEHGIDLQHLCLEHSKDCPEMVNRCMPKDNVGLFTVLEHVRTKQKIFVANLHLTWDPNYSDVKVVQAVLALKSIHDFLTQHNLLNIPVLLMGDFNSTPDSGVYEFLSKGNISPEHPDMRGHDYTPFFSRLGTSHPFSLRSAYTTEMPYTNKTAGFTGIIDYIWFTDSSLIPYALWGPVDEKYMDRVAGCPNPHFASDHLALGGKLYLKAA